MCEQVMDGPDVWECRYGAIPGDILSVETMPGGTSVPALRRQRDEMKVERDAEHRAYCLVCDERDAARRELCFELAYPLAVAREVIAARRGWDYLYKEKPE